MAQEVCKDPMKRKNRRLNHRRVMLWSMMPVFTFQVLREDGVEDPTVDMSGYSIMLMRIGVDVDQRNHKYP
jgi:hypothetical protein